MTHRRPLPMRRQCETFEISFGGLAKSHTVSVGYYFDGAPGEVFIQGGRSGEQVEAIARDGAVLISLALQHNVPVDVMRGAITRDASGVASSIVGAVLDKLVERM